LAQQIDPRESDSSFCWGTRGSSAQLEKYPRT
jgi:hypothetical protein